MSWNNCDKGARVEEPSGLSGYVRHQEWLIARFPIIVYCQGRLPLDQKLLVLILLPLATETAFKGISGKKDSLSEV